MNVVSFLSFVYSCSFYFPHLSSHCLWMFIVHASFLVIYLPTSFPSAHFILYDKYNDTLMHGECMRRCYIEEEWKCHHNNVEDVKINNFVCCMHTHLFASAQLLFLLPMAFLPSFTHVGVFKVLCRRVSIVFMFLLYACLCLYFIHKSVSALRNKLDGLHQVRVSSLLSNS